MESTKFAANYILFSVPVALLRVFILDPTIDMNVISLGICNLPMTRKPSNMRNLMCKVPFTLYKHLVLLMLLSAVKWCCSVVPVLKIQQAFILTSMSNQQNMC
jgi:hypothetical protein